MKESESASAPPPRRRRRHWLRWVVLLALVVGAVFLVLSLFEGPAVPSSAVLVVDLRRPLPERARGDLSDFFAGGARLDLLGLRRAFEAAGADGRVKGVLIETGPWTLDLALAEEVRGLAEGLRRAGKPVIGYLEGADGPGYLAVAGADQVLLDPASSLNVLGISMHPLFLGDALRKVGIELDLVRVGEYKGAYEELTAAGPSPAFKKALEETADSLFTTFTAEIAASRKLAAEAVSGAVDLAPLLPVQAREKKLSDGEKFHDELPALLEGKAGQPVQPMDAGDYLAAVGPARGGVRVAVVHVSGLIADEAAPSLPFLGEVTSARDVAAALREAREDATIRAVLLRIDSPGGSMSASERIWREVVVTRTRKPVVASLGSVAASGGYYAACSADRVIARPATITGSIGVFGGKPVVAKLLGTLAVGVEPVERGRRAGMFSPFTPFTDDERAAVQGLIQDGYRRFVDNVSRGRKKPVEEVEKLARGRVWTGAQAAANGLVDELGGLEEALVAAKSLARIGASEEVELVPLPPPRSLLDLLRGSRPPPSLESAAPSLSAPADLESLVRVLASCGFDGRPLALSPCCLTLR